jgi:hypothetical protein
LRIELATRLKVLALCTEQHTANARQTLDLPQELENSSRPIRPDGVGFMRPVEYHGCDSAAEIELEFVIGHE